MRRAPVAIFVALSLLFLFVVFTKVRNWAVTTLADVKEVPQGCQEVAWISPATSGDAWERLVAALKQLQKDGATEGKSSLHVDFDQAFLQLTADVPEVALSFAEVPESRLLIRWYKLSGENPASRWVERLRARRTPPLAIIGGETSDRALTLARVLNEARGKWSADQPGAKGGDPLFLITTATAERYHPGPAQAAEFPHDSWPKLMDVYAGRSFRFAFTNQRMVEAVLDFVRQNPVVWAQKNSSPAFGAGVVGVGQALPALAFLHAGGHGQLQFLYTLAWWDDGYSKDLAEIFLKVFIDQQSSDDDEAPLLNFYNDYVDYSVGDFFQPNPREELAVGLFLANNPRFRDQAQLLALPTGAQRARRFLRTLCRRAPTEVRNIVVVTGDAITFNQVYRDRDVSWNVQDLPVPLVFFSHRNPTDGAAGFGQREEGLRCTTGTQDLLLHRDIVEALVLAVFDGPRLLADSDQVLARLKDTRWGRDRVRNARLHPHEADQLVFFDEAGNRRPGTGEHVIWLKPSFEGQRNLAEATISVWHVAPEQPPRWRLSGRPLAVHYDQPRREAQVHGED